MKIITQLNGRLIDADFREGAGHHHHVGQQHEVPTGDNRKGIFTRAMRIGPEGIIFKAGKAEVVMRTEDLWKLAELADPQLRIPEKIEVPAAAGTRPSTLDPRP